MTSICLNMIVKNEAHVIEKCLASVKPFITRWSVVDTGSNDGTQDIVRKALDGVPGHLHERPWVDFGHNRTEALELAKDEHTQYLVIIDADDTLEPRPGFVMPELTKDAYQLEVHHSGSIYRRNHIVKASKAIRWVGVLHEYLEMVPRHTSGFLDGLVYRFGGGGARSLDPKKFEKDAAVFEKALLTDPTNDRSWFYLAQSYRDCGNWKEALRAYTRRSQMGGFAEEEWFSAFRVAEMKEALNDFPLDVKNAYEDAYIRRPTRNEPLVGLARYLNSHNRFAEALPYGLTAMHNKMPSDVLFVDQAAHTWRPLDEVALSYFWMFRKEEAAELYKAILKYHHDVPAADRARIENNMEFCNVS